MQDGNAKHQKAEWKCKQDRVAKIISELDPVEYEILVEILAKQMTQTSAMANRYNGIRHVIGVPVKKVRQDDPEHSLFRKMINRIVEAESPYVLGISGFSFMLQTCPGGMEYLVDAGFGFEGKPSRLIVHDFSPAWVYHNQHSNVAIRSAEHLYNTIESELARLNCVECLPQEIFLLTSGDPNIGNSLVDLWKKRHPMQTLIYSSRSPVEAAGDFVEKKLNHTDIPLQRHYISGPEILWKSPEELKSMAGIILLIGVEDAYRRSSSDPSIASEVFRKLVNCYGPMTSIYAFHAGYERDITFNSTLENITDDLISPEMFAHQPYTFVICRV